ncbi:MAG: exonuclease V subunit gamma, partial [Cyanobacteriota bacterium]|nr:exonuclease V subunit gamma [Cyanobacteriota bacterium]
WRVRCCGQGLMPPGAAAALDQDRLEQRWQNLQHTLFSLGPVHQLQSDSNTLNTGQLMAGELAVHISTSKLRARTLLQAWLQHLLVQLGNAPCSSAVICRPEGSAKADQFQIAMRWQTMAPQEAAHQIAQLQGLAAQGAEQCWPVPPESGLARALALAKGQDAADRAFTNRWQGGFSLWAERDQAQLSLCFGNGCDAQQLLQDPGFKTAFASLYQPLLEARCQ